MKIQIYFVVSLLLICYSGFTQTPANKYRPVTYKYSDGTSLTLGGYGNPADYSFNNKNTDKTVNSQGSTGSRKLDRMLKVSKKTEHENVIYTIEWGNSGVPNICYSCTEKKSKKAYQKLITLVKDEEYGEALYLARNEINTSFTVENPDAMSEYEYYGLLVYIHRQCMAKYPNGYLKEHYRHIGTYMSRVQDLMGNSYQVLAFRLKAFIASGFYDQAKDVIGYMRTKKEQIDDATLLKVELNSSVPDRDTIRYALRRIIYNKINILKSFASDATGQANSATDESALGSFFIDVLYNLSSISPEVAHDLLPEMKYWRGQFELFFKSMEGKERFLLIDNFIKEFENI